MASRKRFEVSVARRQPDRCPTAIWLHADTISALGQHMGVQSWEDIESALNVDRWRYAGIDYQQAEDYEDRILRFIPDEYQDLDDSYVNQYGEVIRENKDKIRRVLWSPLQNLTGMNDLAAYPFPSNLDPEQLNELPRRVRELKATDTIVNSTVMQPFTYACKLRGFENFLSDFIIRPAIVDFIYDRAYEIITRKAVAIAKAGVDVLQITGDIAMDRRLLMAPDTWRRHDKPRLMALVASVKAANPDVIVGLHSDGKLTDIVPDLVDCGIEMLNPVQPECMNPEELKREWGKHLLLHGCISLQTLVAGSKDDVERAVVNTIRECGKAGGLILGPANAILPEVPIENILTMYRSVF